MRHSGRIFWVPLAILGVALAALPAPAPGRPITGLDPELYEPSTCAIPNQERLLQRLRIRAAAFAELYDSAFKEEFSAFQFQREFRGFMHPLQSPLVTASICRSGTQRAQIFHGHRSAALKAGYRPVRTILRIRLDDEDCSVAYVQVHFLSPAGEPVYECGRFGFDYTTETWIVYRWALYQTEWYLPAVPDRVLHQKPLPRPVCQ